MTACWRSRKASLLPIVDVSRTLEIKVDGPTCSLNENGSTPSKQRSLSKGVSMNMIYNSEQYSVVEFGVDHELEALYFGGYEIVDKSGRREAFLGGKLAQSFRRDVNNLIASEPTVEEVDEFLGSYDVLMSQPVLLH
jgi:hypothetical protein